MKVFAVVAALLLGTIFICNLKFSFSEEIDERNYPRVFDKFCLLIAHINSFKFECTDGNSQISARLYCDGIAHCQDGSDETGDDCGIRNNTNRESFCPGDDFQCPCENCNGAYCIPSIWVCDGTKNCPDGFDESNDLCNPPTTTTSPSLK